MEENNTGSYLNKLVYQIMSINSPLAQFYKNQELYHRQSTIINIDEFCSFCQSSKLQTRHKEISIFNKKLMEKELFDCKVIFCIDCKKTRRYKTIKLLQKKQLTQIVNTNDPNKQRMLELLRKTRK